MVVGILFRSDLNSGIRGGPGDTVFEFEIEIGNLVFPVEEFVFGEVLAFFNGSCDGSVFDAPNAWCALPLIKGLAVEEDLRFCRMSTQGEEKES